jgi:hypothetical protein
MTTVTVMHFVCQVAPTVLLLLLLLLLQLTVACRRYNRAAVTNKRKGLSVEGKLA